MQMIAQPWGVTAFGTASVKALPDLVRIRFKVVNRQATPAAAFDGASESIGRVRAVLREHGVADSAVKGSRLGLSTVVKGFRPGMSMPVEHADGERVEPTYQCVAAFALDSGDLDGVQRLLVDLVAAGANAIDGVDFDVTARPALRADARRKAMAAARAKAELYADAAGVRLGAVLHIEDADEHRPEADRYRGGDTTATAAQDLAPGHVIVSAAVILGFAIVSS